MPHVTFIHGIGNKTDSTSLRKAWLDALRVSDGLDLLGEGVTASMCYWADVLYPSPLPPEVGADLEAGEESDDTTAPVDLGTWFQELPAEQQQQVLELAAEAGAISWLEDDEVGDLSPVPAPVDAQVGGPDEVVKMTDFERVPLPGPIKRRVMEAFLRDVHHYLWDVQFSPRPGETFHVRREVRQRAVDALAVGEDAGTHLVVAHSLGSVIAYDVLKNVDGAPRVDGLITVGSPLGLDEVQDKLDPGWSRWDGYPFERVAGRWVNVFDRLDPVCGFDPVLANDFRRRGSALVSDIAEPNWGKWRHSIKKYLRGPLLRAELAKMLGIE